MTGKIIKGIAGFYYVASGNAIYECKARGRLRNEHIKPLVGDNVEMAVLNEEEKKGNIDKVLTRFNELIRPAVANVDQALVIFSVTQPEPSFNLLDRFLVMMEVQNISVGICFNKVDLADSAKWEWMGGVYSLAGYPVYFTSVYENEGMNGIRNRMEGKTTVLAGPSGVGKSSITNLLYPNAKMEVGAISEKIQRGKQTTRHSELFAIGKDTYMMDTPGFSSIYAAALECENLKGCFKEFAYYEKNCRFSDCVHMDEPDCGIKEAVRMGKISEGRYKNYRLFHQELKDKRRC